MNSILKKQYKPPTVIVVVFRVEMGAGQSQTLPVGLSSFQMQSYCEANNSGEGFWGNSTSASGPSTQGFTDFGGTDNQGWSWE